MNDWLVQVDTPGSAEYLFDTMPSSPVTEHDALVWIQEAVAAGRYTPEPHLYRRFRERNMSIRDVKRVIAFAVC
jgi:hypothetical protein